MTYPNRQEALASLEFYRNSAILSLASMYLINSNAVLALNGISAQCSADELSFSTSTGKSSELKLEIELGQIYSTYINDLTGLRETLNQFWKSARRSLIKDSFEIARAYAKANDCLAELNRQPWYQFARMIRNSLSHDFHFRFNDHDRKKLPVSWRDKRITLEMDGLSLPSDHLDPLTTWLLFKHIYEFVENSKV